MIKNLILITFFWVGLAPQANKVQLSNTESELKIEGTSSLHDWVIEAEKLKGTATITKEESKIVNIEQLNFQVEVKGLKSGKKGMDDNTYKALKADQHANITYQFEKILSNTQTSEGVKLSTQGKLTIAGTTKTIKMDVLAKDLNAFKFKGQTTFKMSDYGIEPPTAVFGTIKTGDEVTIKFNVAFK
jgi:polyisoprenoid-binding protein YceI